MGWSKSATVHQGREAWSILDETGDQRAIAIELADAQIIEAAPDLLAAARRASRQLRLSFGPSPADPASGWSTPAACEICCALEAAIARSEGQARHHNKYPTRTRVAAFVGLSGLMWALILWVAFFVNRVWPH